MSQVTVALSLGQRLDGCQPLATRQRALIDLVDVAAEPLRRFLLSRHLSPEHHEEVGAETWLVAIQKVQAGAFRATEGDPISYVIGIAAVLIRRVTLAPSREVPLPEDDAGEGEDPAVSFADSEASMDVARAAAALANPEDQEVLRAILADRTIREIAAQFGCSYKTAWRRYHRCLARCRAALDPVGAEGMRDAVVA